MFRLVLLLSFFLFMQLFTIEISSAQSEETIIETSAERGRGSVENDQNIRSEVAINIPGQPVPPPSYKGGEEGERSSYSRLRIDNWTGWWVKIYIDGDYVGNAAPWGELTTHVPSGPVRMYARADIGPDHLSWGSLSRNIDRTYTWKLTP